MMARSTGIVLGIGAVTVANRTVFHGQPIDWRVPVATALAAVGFSLAERAWPTGTVILAWTALGTVLLTRTDPDVPSPAESAVDWWDETKGT